MNLKISFAPTSIGLSLLLTIILISSCGDSGNKPPKKIFVRPDETEAVREFKTDSFSKGSCIQVLNNGNIVVVSHDYPSIPVTSYTPDGKIVWQQKITMPGDTVFASCVTLTQDGNIVVGGNVGFNDKQRGFICAVGVNGNILWQKKLTCNNVNTTTCLSNGDLALEINTSGLDVMRIKADGTELWQNMYGDPSVYITQHIFALKNNGILLSGYGTIDTGGKQGLQFTYINSDGSTKWTKKYNDTGLDIETPLAMYEDANHCFHIWGECIESKLLKEGVRYMKMDANGNLLANTNKFWEDDASLCKAAVVTKEGKFYIIGDLQNFRVSYRMFLACSDTTGKLLWTRSVGKDQCMSGGDDLAILNGQIVTLSYKCSGAYVSFFPLDGGKATKSNY